MAGCDRRSAGLDTSVELLAQSALWAFFTRERVEKMRVATDPCCRCKETSETVPHLFYECRKSLNRWQLLCEKARLSQASFHTPHGLLDMIDEAICAKKDGEPFTFIFYSLTNSIWKDRNSALFKNKNQETPLLASLELARVELEGNLNKTASNIRWQRGQRAMEELNKLIDCTKNASPQPTREPEVVEETTTETAITLSQELSIRRGNTRDSTSVSERRNRLEATPPRESIDRTGGTICY
ncbi:hypothetical protein R1flu_026810 [Riccia fluitans]|uniref:Reverse transcriptase zinc-binding domain-containing protein n=1 Tax=Riccia fluitans TaxID=41844 RepID=A0ABD1XH15_9MARC